MIATVMESVKLQPLAVAIVTKYFPSSFASTHCVFPVKPPGPDQVQPVAVPPVIFAHNPVESHTGVAAIEGTTPIVILTGMRWKSFSSAVVELDAFVATTIVVAVNDAQG